MDPELNPPTPAAPQGGSSIARDVQAPANEATAALVTAWANRVSEAREYWTKTAFNTMREDMSFCAGRQWPRTMQPGDDNFLDANEDRYVANITLRHVATRVASIYGKNPKIVARRKERMISRMWDGTAQTFQAAMEAAATDPTNPMPQLLIQDALQTMQQNDMNTKMAKTLQLMFEHEVDEQPVPFKVQMKNVVRRGLTTGAAYVKLGWQRVMDLPPEVDRQIDTYRQQLATVERISADLADGVLDEGQAQAETLRLAMAELAATEQVVIREGLTFTFPHSTAIIPDVNTQMLRGFVGAEYVAEEYFLTSDRIKEIYSVEINGTGQAESRPRVYSRHADGAFRPADTGGNVHAQQFHCVWEIYSRVDGMVYVVCDGHPDFLRPPAAPDVKLERFFPWFPFVVNETYSEDAVFPMSDVRLMRNMQVELNRSRQGLREHRRASLPKTYTRKGVLSQADKDMIQAPTPNMVVELESLQPGEKVMDVLQAYSGPQIDGALYDPGPAYEDYLRVLGQQEANLGGTSGSTATEASIAEGSRVSSVSAVVDDLDEFLGELARAAGQVLLLECSKEKVMKVVGPGAVWPEMRREDVAQEIYLDIEAASTGRPNKAQEVQTAQAVVPLLLQIPGVSPEFLARELLRRMDDRLDLTDAFAPGMPSIMMLNRPGGGAAPGAAAPGPGAPSPTPGGQPQEQGGEGAANTPSVEPPQVNAAARPPGRPPMVPLPVQ